MQKSLASAFGISAASQDFPQQMEMRPASKHYQITANHATLHADISPS